MNLCNGLSCPTHISMCGCVCARQLHCIGDRSQEGKPRLLISPCCLEWWWRHRWWPRSARHHGKWPDWDIVIHAIIFRNDIRVVVIVLIKQSTREEAEAEILSTQEHCTVSAIHLSLCVWESGRAAEEINGSTLPLWHDEWRDLLWWSVFLLAECAGCSVNTAPRSPVYLFSVNRRSISKKRRREERTVQHCVQEAGSTVCPAAAAMSV